MVVYRYNSVVGFVKGVVFGVVELDLLALCLRP